MVRGLEFGGPVGGFLGGEVGEVGCWGWVEVEGLVVCQLSKSEKGGGRGFSYLDLRILILLA